MKDPPVKTTGETLIKVIRDGKPLVVTYLDLQVGDQFYQLDKSDSARLYRVVDMSGNEKGDVEITTEIVNLTLVDSIINMGMMA